MRRAACWLLLLASAPALALPLFDGGHTKLNLQDTHFPDDSLWREELGKRALDSGGALRLRFAGGSGGLGVEAHYQLLARHGDTLALVDSAPAALAPPGGLPDDATRWWDLTDTLRERDDTAVVQRLDRLNIAWSGEKTVLRFGRQAVSWGNGLIYTPLDFLNPFDPAAVDTEYKLGDDMLYAQYLLDAGHDWQFVNVQRRDASGSRSGEVSSSAIKFHHFGAEREYDLLLAQHYDQAIVAAGGLANIGDAVLRGDLVLSDSDNGWTASLVADWTWSWVWGGRNVSAIAEYFYNGFGLDEDDYGELLLDGPGDSRAMQLRERLARGELFTIGRHYAAGSLLVELHPLLNLSTNLFCNLGDQSALAQAVLQWDAGQNWQVLGALNLPLGGSGSEYGGLETGVEERTLAVGPSGFVQLAWYF
ncbi:hypothetical protein E4634_17180 [Mangrovimicrobium sediminis]|uniref:Alginate export domain-containing protein n=1 Tax=Mangrovimicrobium sediminis TaxID=2562682 RepID=A0A4Z0LXG1_9GAMM|nr:hypothetical protein [Haliea sp. SAOS-164]TGD71846.1 hypothetical protein E4634_17180 [Haliea sp. SAOS-164]